MGGFYRSLGPEDSKSYSLAFFFFSGRWKGVTDSVGPHLALSLPFSRPYLQPSGSFVPAGVWGRRSFCILELGSLPEWSPAGYQGNLPQQLRLPSQPPSSPAVPVSGFLRSLPQEKALLLLAFCWGWGVPFQRGAYLLGSLGGSRTLRECTGLRDQLVLRLKIRQRKGYLEIERSAQPLKK